VVRRTPAVEEPLAAEFRERAKHGASTTAENCGEIAGWCGPFDLIVKKAATHKSSQQTRIGRVGVNVGDVDVHTSGRRR